MSIKYNFDSLVFHLSNARFFSERILILNTDTSVFWHTDTYSVFFRLNTDTDTSVFENHSGY